MKKVAALLILSVLLLCGCSSEIIPNSNTQNSDAPVQASEPTKNDSAIIIDESKVIRSNIPGCLPVSTTSIKDILNDTGRFAYGRIALPPGGEAVADVYFHLDKPYGENSEGIAYVTYQVLSENTTQIISYNFSKSVVIGDGHDAIKWGLDLLLHIFGMELTDETWADILEIAAKSETDDAWGTDYEGYSSESKGIRLVYANLGENIQIDIRPF